MLDLTPEKIFVLGIVALVVLGPNRLPGAAGSLGRLIGQLRSMTSSIQSEVREAIQEPNDALTSAIAEFRPGQIRQSVRRTITDTLAPPVASAAAGAAPVNGTAATSGPAEAAGYASAPSPGVGAAPMTGPGPAMGGAAWGSVSGWPGTPDDPALN